MWNKEKKRLDEIYQLASQIPTLAEKIQAMDKHLKENVPTHDQTELKIYRALKDRSQ